MTKLTVAQKRIGPILAGHPWVFSGALKQVPEGIEPGAPVALYDEKGVFLASGYFNSYSQIAVRIWSYDEAAVINKSFFEEKIERSFALRKQLVLNKETNACRIINGEGDLLPGLIVDLYDKYLTVQFHNRGIRAWKQDIIDALVEIFSPKGIQERSESLSRKVEQLEDETGILFGTLPDRIKIKENGVQFWIDLAGGQKTGFFLDQRDKRQALRQMTKDKDVLNCYSYSGGFSIYALMGGAKQAVSVDASEEAIELAKANLKLNGFSEKQAPCIVADVKDYLRDMKPGTFDVIVLDPPAFVKDRRKVKQALAGYKAINRLALEKIRKPGLLLTCSCSTHISTEDFRHMLTQSAMGTGANVQIISTMEHGLDHPRLPAFAEGDYLKCFFCRVT